MVYDSLLLAYARKGPIKPLRKSAFRKFCRRNRGLSDIIHTHCGMKIKTVVGDAVDNVLYVYNNYEEATGHVIKTLSGECGSFIDVGCNIGYYSCLYGTANRGGRLYCIDPNPEMIRRTKENLILNDIENYQLLPIAAGAQACKMTLNIPEDRHSLSSLAYVPKRGAATATRNIEVDVKPLTELIERYQIRDALLKVDVEGFEHQVFNGLSETVIEAVKYVIFELSTENLACAGTSISSLLSFAWMKRFDFFRIADENKTVVKEARQILTSNNTSANILLARKGMLSPSCF